MAERLRAMLWCRTCVAGPHLPAFAAQRAGLFADRGLDVEFIPLVAAPDRSLGGLARRLEALADGRADLAFTSVAYLLAAQSHARERLPARFAAVLHQRGPFAALVAADSGMTTAADLGARRTSTHTFDWFVREYRAALEALGADPPIMVPGPPPGPGPTADGDPEAEAIPALADMLAVHSRRDRLLRAVPLDIPVYGSGLVAAERVPLELVRRFADALIAGFALQREQPQVGIGAYRQRFPEISEAHAQTSWSVFEPNAFAGPGPGAMTASAWERTIDYTASVHGLRRVAPECVYHPEMLAEPVTAAAPAT